MDLQTMTTFVRTYFDVDDSDIPQSLITMWANEAERRIYRAHNRWPFYETTVKFSIITGQSDYTTPDLDVAALKAIYDVEVAAPVGPITQMDPATAQERYFVGVANVQGYPQNWSRWNDVLTIWPVPSADFAVTIRGYRLPKVMAATGDTPDMPEDFHQAVLEWVMAKACLHQEDPQLNAIYAQNFQSLVQELKDDALKDDGGPLVFGGGKYQSRGFEWPHVSGELRGPGLGGWGQ